MRAEVVATSRSKIVKVRFGTVTIRDEAGQLHRLRAGDSYEVKVECNWNQGGAVARAVGEPGR